MDTMTDDRKIKILNTHGVTVRMIDGVYHVNDVTNRGSKFVPLNSIGDIYIWLGY